MNTHGIGEMPPQETVAKRLTKKNGQVRRKRCPRCGVLIEPGETVVLTDDRYMESRVQWFGREYARGARHLWHPSCREAWQTEIRAAEQRRAEQRERRNQSLAALDAEISAMGRAGQDDAAIQRHFQSAMTAIMEAD